MQKNAVGPVRQPAESRLNSGPECLCRWLLEQRYDDAQRGSRWCQCPARTAIFKLWCSI